VEPVVQAVHDLVDLKASGIFHVVGDERISKYEFGLKLAQEFNLATTLLKPGYIADQSMLALRPHDMSLSNQKICKLLGRKLGGVDAHIAKLHQQEQNGLAQELQKL
jgi:dTDP-4-dehydrorhamnose reductase